MPNEPNQQPQTSSLSGFGGLAGIDEARDVHVRPISTLEKLMELAFRTRDFLSKRFSDRFKDYGDRPNCVDFLPVYCYVQPMLEELCFDETDISSFVSGFTNQDYTKSDAEILGVFTSCLAYSLTERNREQGKRTWIYVDGKGARFDYLFCCLPDFDEVIIEDFTGDWIGHSNGNYNYMTTGEKPSSEIREYCDTGCYSKILSRLRKEKRTHKCLFGINLIGTSIFGYAGGIDQVVLINIDGEYAGVNCGLSPRERFVNQLVAVNVKGDNAFCGIGKEGRVNHVVAVNVKGKEAFHDIASHFTVNKIVVDNIRGDKAFGRYGYGNPAPINQMIFTNLHFRYLPDISSEFCVSHKYEDDKFIAERLQGEFYFRGGCKELICMETATQKQCRVIRRERAEDMLRLAHSLPGKPYKEVLRIADELYALRPVVPKKFFK